jgi:hypothetical protein
MAYAISKDNQELLRQVESMGIAKGAVLEYLFSLKCLCMTDPGLNNMQVNSRMSTLGWQDIRLDDEILKLATTCFKAETPIN